MTTRSRPPDLPLFTAESAALALGSDIAAATLAALERAHYRIWASFFIVSAALDTDRSGRVRELLDALARAARRGVDTRLLVDDYTSERDEFAVNLVAAHYLIAEGVPVRVFRSERHPSTHSKCVIVDDSIALIGSGNWSPGGLLANLEAAVVVTSRDLNATLASRFAVTWDAAEAPEPLT